MFVSVSPPESVREELAEFLEPRQGMPWISSRLWHITLAFCESVPEHRIDDFEDGLASAAGRYDPFDLTLAGAGVFPSVERAKVFWAGIEERDGRGDRLSGDHSPEDHEGSGRDGTLHRLARNARAAANNVGGAPDGKAFHPHLTLARLTRPIEGTKWLRVLDTYRGTPWRVDHIELVASHLREGPNRTPRYETIARIPLGEPDHRWWRRS